MKREPITAEPVAAEPIALEQERAQGDELEALLSAELRCQVSTGHPEHRPCENVAAYIVSADCKECAYTWQVLACSQCWWPVQLWFMRNKSCVCHHHFPPHRFYDIRARDLNYSPNPDTPLNRRRATWAGKPKKPE